jgi:hypothetical protein
MNDGPFLYLTRSAMCGLAANMLVAVSRKAHVHIHRFIKYSFLGIAKIRISEQNTKKNEDNFGYSKK